MTWTFYQYRVGISKHVLYPLLFENHWKAVTGQQKLEVKDLASLLFVFPALRQMSH